LNPGVWNSLLTEISLNLNYVLVVFLLQIAGLFGKQWYDDKKRQISNNIILSYALYYVFITAGVGIAFYLSSLGGNPFVLYGDYMIISIILRGIGGVLFAFVLELKILKQTKFLITIVLLTMVTITPFLINTPFITQALNILSILILTLPFIFTIYFLRKTYGEVRRKLSFAFLGLSLIGTALVLSSYTADQILQILFPYPAFIIFPFKILAIFGVFLLIYGFRGYSFFLEAEWKENLVSFYIIEKTQKTELYHKDFAEGEILQESVFAGGLAGITKIIDELTSEKKDFGSKAGFDTINLGKFFIILYSGESIISALLVRKNIQHARYFLQTVTSKFESSFRDLLKASDLSKGKEIFKITEMLIRDIIKL